MGSRSLESNLGLIKDLVYVYRCCLRASWICCVLWTACKLLDLWLMNFSFIVTERVSQGCLPSWMGEKILVFSKITSCSTDLVVVFPHRILGVVYTFESCVVVQRDSFENCCTCHSFLVLVWVVSVYFWRCLLAKCLFIVPLLRKKHAEIIV